MQTERVAERERGEEEKEVSKGYGKNVKTRSIARACKMQPLDTEAEQP